MTSKRERYERANNRGGLGVRKRLSEDSLKTSYRLNGVQTGSVVIRAHDKYRGDFTKGFDVGILVRRTAASAYIHWAGDEDYTVYNQGDARFEVDRGRWKFLGMMGADPLDPDDPISIALTKLREDVKMSSWRLAESVKKISPSQSSDDDPQQGHPRQSAEDARTNTSVNTSGLEEKPSRKRSRSKNKDVDSRSMESPPSKSKSSGKRKAGDVPSVDASESRQSTTAMKPSSGEDFSVEIATSDSDSSEITPNDSEQQQHISRGQLTRGKKSIKVPASALPDIPAPTTDGVDETEETEDEMAENSKAAQERARAQAAAKNGQLQERETYTAKQVATRCGTDSKTMRKFFRSSHSTVEAVGQGGRYEFDAKDLPKIKREFEAWRKRATSRRTGPRPIDQVHSEAEIAEAKRQATQLNDDEFSPDQISDAVEAQMRQENAELEPSEDDIAELEDIDLDLDDLDALDD